MARVASGRCSGVREARSKDWLIYTRSETLEVSIGTTEGVFVWEMEVGAG